MMTSRDERTETATAFAANHKAKAQPSVEKGGCKHCGRFGHEESSCYEIIGYSPGWGTRGKSRSRGRGICGGHPTEAATEELDEMLLTRLNNKHTAVIVRDRPIV